MFRMIFTALIAALVTLQITTASAQGARTRALGEDPPLIRNQPKSAATHYSEAELARQAKAFQRTMAEGIVAGAAVGLLADMLSSNDNNSGLQIGIGAGAISGSYVARLQKKYRRKELRLERIRDDVTRANQELAASIATMQAVVAYQQSELNGLRASGAKKRQIRRELKQAKANLNNMSKAIKGAQKWEKEFKSTRSLRLIKGQATGIDTEIALLSQRIAAMKSVANQMKGVTKS
ncbi:hypothetical protein [Neptunicoccus cionae]|uniref:Glycine zipper domain-containing protein n=1 Tax=Neptunicoccus cionae TaxID=2035344 RepID=A0A916QYF8_9RHOB|nr:hypothetical protein [Amylibacter cionae]GGA21165.1 hypothetical protein GCM10011498_22300 [Amylibacter cionae]